MRLEEFRSQFRSSSAKTAKVSNVNIRPKAVDQNKNVLSAERIIPTKDGCPNREARKPKCANCKGPHVASYKGCPEYKKQAFGQHLVSKQKMYASVINQNSLPQPKTNSETFTFTTEQLTKFVANVHGYTNPPTTGLLPKTKKDTLDLKSGMCHKVSYVVKTILNVAITGKKSV